MSVVLVRLNFDLLIGLLSFLPIAKLAVVKFGIVCVVILFLICRRMGIQSPLSFPGQPGLVGGLECLCFRGRVHGRRLRPNGTGLNHMASANVFIEILLASKTLTSVSIAVGIRTKERGFGSTILLMHFALVT